MPTIRDLLRVQGHMQLAHEYDVVIQGGKHIGRR